MFVSFDLDEDQLKEIIADKYNVDEEQVYFKAKEVCTSYGESERRQTRVTCVICKEVPDEVILK